ncbi:MAG: TonB family protein [Elusimicrobiota bacterium]
MTAAAVAADFSGESRIGAAIGVSLILHLAGMTLFLFKHEIRLAVPTQEIDNIDILEQEQKRELVKPKRRAVRNKEMAKNFLKMALPARPEGLRDIKMKAPEARRIMMDVPKLKLDEKKLKLRDDMKLDLNKNRPQLAKLDQKVDLGRRRAPVEVPQLALVGTRRAPKEVLDQIQLAERRERSQIAGLGSIDLGGSRRKSFDTAPRAVDRTRTTGTSNRLLSMLPAKHEALKMQPRSAPQRGLDEFTLKEPAPLPTRKKETFIQEVKEEKKAVEIEGPLSSRKVRDYSVPRFPKKLEEYGVYEAEVRIKFYVSPIGNVLEDRLSVESSSSYGWLDRLAMEHLKKWRFEPLPMGGRNEWGVITFRFFLE